MPDRIQREVEELLEKLDTFPPKRSLWTRMRDSFSRGVQRLGGLRMPSLSAGHVLLIAIAVIVGAWVILPSDSGVGRWIIAGGIIAFIGAFIFSLRRQSSGPTEKYWRDRPLDLRRPSGPRGHSWWDRWRNR
ncbi:MAG TPA: hypothetical protein VFP63_00830 [Dehalococcoidia bacterium]|nr:hypothetical protein [Dehalococcoidia bacterium]